MNPCDSCAFREGSETHDREPYNGFRGQIAALSGLPFYCHHGLNWRMPIITRRGMSADVDGNVQRLRICEGWRSEVGRTINARIKNRMIRRGLGRACFDALESVLAETDIAEKRELWSELRTSFKLLLRASKLKIVHRKTAAAPEPEAIVHK